MELIEGDRVDQALRHRFCRTEDIPIKLFSQPYFNSRIKLLDKMYGAEQKFKAFMEEIKGFESKQAYLEFYNKVRENAIRRITESKGFKELSECNMAKYAINSKGISDESIYRIENDGGTFISVDLAKANFTALRWFNLNTFGDKQTYEEFIAEFAGGFKHIIESKYTRQAIFRKCKLSKQAKIQRFIMDHLLNWALLKVFELSQISCFRNDEIVIRVPEDYTSEQYYQLCSKLDEHCYLLGVKVHYQWFTLHNIPDTAFYYKKYIAGEGKEGSIELKCVDDQSLPFILRQLAGESVTEEDLVFLHEGRLAKLLEAPVFKI